MRVLLLSLLAAHGAACASPSPYAAQPPGPQAREVIEQVNALRALHGLPPLAPAPALVAAARAHAAEQAALGRISHDGADGSVLMERLERVGYAARAAGENVASGWSEASGVTQGWWESPGHRENLLRPQTSEIGVGAARDEAGRAYWTLIVAAPDREV